MLSPLRPMSPLQRVLLILLAGLFAALGAWLWLDAPGGSGLDAPAPRPDGGALTGAGRQAPTLPPEAHSPPPQQRVDSYPLSVVLERIGGSGRLAAEGARAQGSGAVAGLSGAVHGFGGEAVRAEIEFIGGPNTGRVLRCDASGNFSAADLYPGLAVVEVRGPGIPGAMREVLLRKRSQARLTVGFQRPATVYGQVVDSEGAPLAGARVRFDGQEVTTDAAGEFHLPRVASGVRNLVLVEKPGFARLRQVLPVPIGQVVAKDRVRLVLRRGCRLRVDVRERLGADGQAQLFLLPTVGQRHERSFPWFLVNPVRVYPGGTVTIDDLPAGDLRVALFHRGARCTAKLRSVHLTPERTSELELHLAPAPYVRGVVTREGEPVAGALVVIEAPDRVAAGARGLQQPPAIFETAVLSIPPPGVQTALTDALGRFLFSAYETIAPVRYLSATGPDGVGWSGTVVRQGEREFTLELVDVKEPDRRLEIEFPEREIPLAVELMVGGTERESVQLAPDEPLVIDGLAPGLWRVRLDWRRRWRETREVELADAEGLVFRLPVEARLGATAKKPPRR